MADVPCAIIIRNGNVLCLLAKLRAFILVGKKRKAIRGVDVDLVAEIDGFRAMVEDYRCDTLLTATVGKYQYDSPSPLSRYLSVRDEAIPLIRSWVELAEARELDALSAREATDLVSRLAELLHAVRNPMLEDALVRAAQEPFPVDPGPVGSVSSDD